jgi:hypothetical protein
MNATIPRNCLSCGKPVRGRSDKKFCDDLCRNWYNNQQKSSDAACIRTINGYLKKNRNVLEEILGTHEDTGRATPQLLMERGFRFQYHTHTYTNKKGDTYHFCYEYGYLQLDSGRLLIVKRKEREKISA